MAHVSGCIWHGIKRESVISGARQLGEGKPEYFVDGVRVSRRNFRLGVRSLDEFHRKYVSGKELMTTMLVSETTLRSWRTKRKVQAIKALKCWYYDRADVIAAVSEK